MTTDPIDPRCPLCVARNVDRTDCPFCSFRPKRDPDYVADLRAELAAIEGEETQSRDAYQALASVAGMILLVHLRSDDAKREARKIMHTCMTRGGMTPLVLRVFLTFGKSFPSSGHFSER